MFCNLGLQRYNIDDFEDFENNYDFKDALSRDPNEQDEDGHSKLHALVWNWTFYGDNMQSLINKGANLELRNRNGKTAFLMAVVYRNKEMIERLIENGADVKVQDNAGNNALHYMALPELNDWWYEEEKINRTLLILERLLKEGVDVNAKNQLGNTPLMWAARGKYLKIVKMLLESGADVHLQNKKLETCLHFASTYIQNDKTSQELWDERMTDVLQELARYGASVNCGDRSRQTPFDRIRISTHPARLTFANDLVRMAVLACSGDRLEYTFLPPPDPLDQFILNYTNECLREISWMDNELHHGRPYCRQFALKGVSGMEEGEAADITTAVFLHLTIFEHPIYLSIILARFQLSFLRRRLKYSGFHLKAGNRYVDVNCDVISTLSSYLDRKDIFNLLCVFLNASPERRQSLKRRISEIS